METLFTLLSLATAAIFFVLWRIEKNKTYKCEDDDQAIIDRAKEYIAQIKTDVNPLWGAIQKRIGDDLYQPGTRFQQMAGLLKKLELLTISDGERHVLLRLLEERAVDMSPEVTKSERASAKLMAGVMTKVLEEAELDEPLGDVQLVGNKGIANGGKDSSEGEESSSE